MKALLIISAFLIVSVETVHHLTTKEGEVWMSKNLSVSTFRNGDTLFHASSNEEWQTAFKNKIPAYCYFENDSTHNKNLGKLYNFYAVKDDRGLAPEGWHVATDSEWESLINEFGGNEKAAKKLVSNDFQFKTGGIRDVDSQFSNLGLSSLFWTATIDFNFLSYNRQIWADDHSSIRRGSSHHAMGLYVRCVKNK